MNLGAVRLATRVQRLEDRAALSELRVLFFRYVDEARWDELVGLFVEDGWYRGGGRNLRGHRELLSYFADAQSRRERSWHFLHNETLEIDGDTAVGGCYFECPTVVDRAPWISAGSFEDRFCRTARGWRFSGRTIELFYKAPLSEGWVGGVAAGSTEDARST